MALTHNLYPPIMPNIIPAFIRSQPCRIYFGLSKYNSIQDIKNVQVTVTNIDTNMSALRTDEGWYPAEIKIANLQYDDSVTGDYCYYIELSPESIVKKDWDTDSGSTLPTFRLNQYYKIQLRFTNTKAADIPTSDQNSGDPLPQPDNTWLSNNIQYFSEWSRACLIRGISHPTLNITTPAGLDTSSTITLNTPPAKIVGSLSFAISEETDTLANYNIKIYNQNKIVFDSTTVYPEQPNIIDYEIPYNFTYGKTYSIAITYTTQCLYTKTNTYAIKIKEISTDNPWNLAITITPNNDDGYIHIQVSMEDSQETPFSGKQLLIYRASSKDNFSLLEKTYIINNAFSSPITWQDLSIENGLWYKYSLYVLDNNGATLYTPVVSDPVLCMFEDMYLISDDTQLKLQFNPSVTGFQYMVSDSQQTTIGGQFPYVRRNGANYYRTFNISGLISSLVDETDWFDSSVDTHDNTAILPHINFTSKQQQYGDSYNLYTDYESQNKISDYLNPLYEKLFKEKVQSFLYKDEAKLFKSPTEGNIIVYLSNITFEPQTTLGRILYSFSATATEIAEPTFNNYIKYNIIHDPSN